MFNNESIKQYSVAAVTDFVVNGTPLSQGIAKIASENQLNPEQIKRIVEASNTLTHLKLLSSSSDRTFEFPVAKYETVLGNMVMPAEGSSPFVDQTKITRQESAVNGDTSGENIKYASTRAELETYTAKAIISTKAHLEKLAYDKQSKLLEIEDSLNRLNKQENSMEKFAEVAEDSEFGLVYEMEKSASLNSKLVFTDNELTEARKLVCLIKEAKEIVKDELEKKAFLSQAIGTLGGAVGRVIGGIAAPIAKGAVNSVKNVANLAMSNDKLKLAPRTAEAIAWKDKAKKIGNTGMNLGFAGLTTHSAGSVWDQLQ